jgi:hypothetical protein
MSRHDPKNGPADQKLADKLFRLVQESQGKSFISDGCEVLSRTELLSLASGSLWWTRKTVRLLEKFIEEN